MGIEIAIKCVRCNTELDVVSPLLFKDPILEISVFRCKCKDVQPAVEADVKGWCQKCDPAIFTTDAKFCSVCGFKF